MKILINLSNIKIGGGIQASISLINELNLIEKDIEFHIILSKEVSKQINKLLFKNLKLYNIANEPKPFIFGYKAKTELNNIEYQIQPDIVFSIFGPSYWKPKTIHLAGFALGLSINPDSLFYKQISFWQKIKFYMYNKIHLFYILKDSDYFVTETEVVKTRLVKYGKVEMDKIFVIENSYGNQFSQPLVENEIISNKIEKFNKQFKLLVFCSNYKHKNMQIIPKVCEILNQKKINYQFFVTISSTDYHKIFNGYEEKVLNLGPIDVKHSPFIYSISDALFLPTLLESFTATYPEAMIMQKPILTSKLDFAQNICKDAACYFNPLDAHEIAEKIGFVIQNPRYQNTLITNGNERAKQFLTPQQKVQKYVDLLINLGV